LEMKTAHCTTFSWLLTALPQLRRRHMHSRFPLCSRREHTICSTPNRALTRLYADFKPSTKPGLRCFSPLACLTLLRCAQSARPFRSPSISWLESKENHFRSLSSRKLGSSVSALPLHSIARP